MAFPRPTFPLACPVCNGALSGIDTLRCAAGHAFDVSAEGYVNLLGSHQPSGKSGDTREMLRARRAFLAGGHYDAIAEMLLETLAAHVESTRSSVLVDAGCGEGTYTGRLAEAHNEMALFGVDVAKEACRIAAKAQPRPRFVVADVSRRLPFIDSSVHAVTNVFAPRNPAEFARVLSPSGVLLVVIPAPDHLAELRRRFDLLAIEQDKRESVIAAMADAGLAHVTSDVLAFRFGMEGEALSDLINMTPNYHHLTDAQRSAIRSTEAVTARASVVTLVFRRGM